jgi:glucose/mannose-6-phosphate isomerase
LSSGRTLSPEAVAEVDVSGQFAEVLGLPDHLRDALWRVESASLKPHDSPGGLVIAGVGGSSAGGALARAALGDAASRPIALARDYALPGWTTPDTTVLCASYSGNTEETLAAYDAAQALGARTIVVTTGGKLAEQARVDGVPVIPLPGGFESRAAVGYSLVVALEVAALCGAGESMRAEVDVAAEHAASLAAAWGPESSEGSLAKTLARGLHGTIPQIAGAALTAPVAYRWKTQINENAKAPAFAAELPELDHNELVGWDGASEFGSFSAVFLDDSDLHPRVRQRVELTRGLIASRGGATFRIESIGQTRLQRLVSLVLLGDLVSLYLAALRGVDPGPVTVVDSLRSALNGAE